jgi:transcriptional regulator with XRE-family HTH domain
MELRFGARLRHQREQRGVTLAQICADTKINQTILQSLESDDVSQWPRGLFGRAYLRDYARAIGMDADAVVSEFLTLHPDFALANPELDALEAADRNGGDRPTGRLRRALGAFSAFAPAASRPAAVHRQTAERAFEVPLGGFGEGTLSYESTVMTPEPLVAADDDPSLFAEDLPPVTALAAQASTPTPAIELTAFADICSRLARAIDWTDLRSLLGDAARLLKASGMIVWQWDAAVSALRPVLAHGYADDVMARMPLVGREAENAVAAAFRSGERCVIDGADGGIDALVIPSIGISGCGAVLALELRSSAPSREAVCALAAILAAQLAMLLPAG